MEITSDNKLIRPSGRAQNELRNIEFIPNYIKYGSEYFNYLIKYSNVFDSQLKVLVWL